MLRVFSPGICRCLSKSSNILSPISSPSVLTGVRHLYSRERLGVENFIRNIDVHNQKMGTLKDRFRKEVRDFMEQSNPVVFTADLKAMIHLVENEEDLELTERMVRLYQKQQSDLSFAQFNFGPLLLRLFYLMDKPEKALELYKDQELLDSGLFDQMSSQLILLDILYEAGRYDDVHTVMSLIAKRQVGGIKYPMDCMTVALTTCHKQNTAESYEKMIEYVQGCTSSGQGVSQRGLVHAILLALEQSKTNEAMEVVNLIPPISKKNKKQPLGIQNAKLLTYAKVPKVDEALLLLRSVLENDIPDHMKSGGEIFHEILLEVENSVHATESKEVLNQYEALVKALKQGNHIAYADFTEYVFRPIVSKRLYQDGHKSRQQHKRLGQQNVGRQSLGNG